MRGGTATSTSRWRLALIPVQVTLLSVAFVLMFSADPSPGHGLGHVLPGPVAFAAPAQTELPRTGWTASADSEETVRQDNRASNVLDGSTATLWHTPWSGTPGFPHQITIDMKAVQSVSGLRYTPRQTSVLNGTVGRFRVEVSTDDTTWTEVGSGTWADDRTDKTASFAAVPARYVRLVALSEAGGRGSWSSAAEINLLAGSVAPPTAPPPGTDLPREDWTATADSEETARADNRVSNVLDGRADTMWHTTWGSTAPGFPHHIALDLGGPQSVAGLRYTPRQDSSGNGRIGRFRVEASLDGTSWTEVAAGTWADSRTDKTASFASVEAAHIRLVALSEAGGRGPWSSAAEINLMAGLPPEPPTVPSGDLPRTGWVATASSQETGSQDNRAGNVLDGLATTMWHTPWSGTPAYPHNITIDMGSTRSVSGLRYTPRQDTSSNGAVGRFRVEVSADGSAWAAVASGTWADSKADKTVRFAAVVTRHVRLVALSEAGGRGQWASAAELNLLTGTPPAVAGSLGSWGPTITFPLVPTAAAAFPDNTVLMWSAYAPYNFGGSRGYTQTALYDVTTGEVSQRVVDNTGHDMFCPGTSRLADGRLLVNGGSNARETSIYDSVSDTWSAGPDMVVPRGYQANTTLADGSVFTLGGSWSGGQGGKSGEVWSPATNTWRLLSGVPATPFLTADPQGVYRSDNHMWLHPVSGGRLLHTGPSRQMHWISTAGNGSVTPAGMRGDSDHAMNGTSVVYDVDRILTVGGAPAYQNSDATTRAHTIDARGATPVVNRVGDMRFARAFHNAVVLPDGTVLVLGGQPRPVPFTDTGAVLTAELWDPATGQFRSLAAAPTPRTYHSSALLLPDGRVMSAGGGQCGNCSTNHPDAEIFTPPYLLNGDGTPRARPSITATPATADRGSTISVTTDRSVTAFALVRYGASTHTVDNDQRRVPLSIASSSGTTYALAVPGDGGVLPPGDYMVFAMTADGTPSVAATVRVTTGS